MSDYLENKLANHVFRNMDFESPQEVWIGLFYNDPKDHAQAKELVGNGYQRESVNFDTPIDGLMKNSEKIIFHKASSAWVVISHLALFTEKNGGHMLFRGEVSTPVKIGKGKNFVIRVADLQVGFE